MTKKRPAKKPESSQADPNEQFLVLGHLIKYNLYLLTKSVVFSAITTKTNNIDEAVSMTNKVMDELDLDTKRRAQQSQDS
jgi:hypothetical protein